MLNADLEPTGRWWGYGEKTQFSEKLTGEMADASTIKDKQARYKKAPTLALANSLTSFHESRGETASAIALVKDAIGLAPEQKSELRLQVLEMQFAMVMGEKEGASLKDLETTMDEVLNDPKTKAEAKVAAIRQAGRFYYDKGQKKEAFAMLEKLHPMDRDKLSEDGQKDYDVGTTYMSWGKDYDRFFKTPAKVDAALLKSYAGDYGPRHLSFNEGRLHYKRGENAPLPLIPIAKNMFFIEGKPFFHLEVVVGEDGNPSKLVGHYAEGNTDESERDENEAVN